jgi:hypothetical protein
MPEWVQVLQALLVPTIAVVGALLAWQQVKIARSKLRHDLFDRRFAVFEAARTLLRGIMRDGNASMTELGAYIVGVIDAPFLLDESTSDYLMEIRRRTIKLQSLKSAYASDAPVDDRKQVVQKAYDEMNWLVAQLDVLPGKFKPFLTLEP